MTPGATTTGAAARCTGGGSPCRTRSKTVIAAGPGVVPSSSRSSERSSSNARSASAGLPAASWTSISSRCADSRNGAAAIAARAACSAAPSSRPPWRSPASASVSSARSRIVSSSRRCSAAQPPSASGRNVCRSVASACARAVGRERVVAGLHRRLGLEDRGRRGLDVHARLVEAQPQLAATGQHAFAQRAAQLRQQRAQRGVGGGRRTFGPEHVDQLVARAAAVTIEHEVGEQQTALPPREPGVQSAPARVDQNRAAQPDIPALSHLVRRTLSARQGFSKVSATRRSASSSQRRTEQTPPTAAGDTDVDFYITESRQWLGGSPVMHQESSDPRFPPPSGTGPTLLRCPRGGRRLTPGHPPLPP